MTSSFVILDVPSDPRLQFVPILGLSACERPRFCCCSILNYATPGLSAERQRFGARFGTPQPRSAPQLHDHLLAGGWRPGRQPHRRSVSELAAGAKTPRSLPSGEWIALVSSGIRSDAQLVRPAVRASIWLPKQGRFAHGHWRWPLSAQPVGTAGAPLPVPANPWEFPPLDAALPVDLYWKDPSGCATNALPSSGREVLFETVSLAEFTSPRKARECRCTQAFPGPRTKKWSGRLRPGSFPIFTKKTPKQRRLEDLFELPGETGIDASFR